jgi:hypothetical protein
VAHPFSPFGDVPRPFIPITHLPAVGKPP